MDTKKDKDFWSSQEELAVFEKNKYEKISLKKCTKDDIDYIDIRVMRKPFGSDEYTYTNKGICLELSLYKQIEDIVKEKVLSV